MPIGPKGSNNDLNPESNQHKRILLLHQALGQIEIGGKESLLSPCGL